MTEAGSDCAPQVEGHAIDVAAAGVVAAALKALAEPLRLRMLSFIATSPEQEACVCDLTELTDVSQPTVSHHLKIMRTAGVLTSERRGTWVWYRIAPGYQSAVTALLESVAPAALLTRGVAPLRDRLSDVEGALDRLCTELAVSFPRLAFGVVQQTVRESYAALARSATVSRHLLSLTQRFAHQRLTDLSRDSGEDRPQVLFVCVANAGRSQLAAALVQHYAGDRVVVRSAGSSPASGIHPRVRAELEALGYDDEAFPKPLTDDAVRAADVVITMGCGDVCPVLPGTRYEEWLVGDPALASPEGVRAIRADLDQRVRTLLADLARDINPTAITTTGKPR